MAKKMNINANKTPLKKLLCLSTPCYVIDNERLKANLKILSDVQKASGCKILLALKAFSTRGSFDLISKHLDGVAASSLCEAKLGKHFGGEVHTYSPGFSYNEIGKLAKASSHIIFNSFNQLRHLGTIALKKNPRLSIGLRINPEYSEISNPRYDPCRPDSRLGMTISQFCTQSEFDINGFHFHSSFENGFNALKNSFESVEKRFGHYFSSLQWFNLGGGQQITGDDYDRDGLIALLKRLHKQYNVTVYLEPGETVVSMAGYFVTSVVDIIDTTPRNIIVDSSAVAHLPDISEGTFYPTILDYWNDHSIVSSIVGGTSCSASDIFGKFDLPLKIKIGDKIIFPNTAAYSAVKVNKFNGIKLPKSFFI